MRPPVRKKAGSNLESGCPIDGPPDIPAIRDMHIPDASTPIKTIRLKINAFGGFTTQEDVDGQVAQLNADFLPSRIQFVAETELITSPYDRPLNLRATDEIKPIFADSPETKLNVYVVVPIDYTGLIGFSYFPFGGDPLDPIGGVVMHAAFFGPGWRILTHEIGHSFGLYHTFTGVSEVYPPCSECYERADGLNGDTTGDLCSDTPSTPINYDCAPPGGIDPCSNTPWGPTSPQNYMSYSSCYSEFTPQQAGRMHAWILERLSTWLVPDVAVSLSASPEPVLIGSNLTYTLSVSNRSMAPISDLTVTNVLPLDVFLTSVSSNVIWSALSNQVTITFPNIATGSTAVATITVIPFQAGMITNALVLPVNALVAGQMTNRTFLISTVSNNPALTGPMLMVRDVAVVEGNSGTTNAIFTVAVLPAGNSIITTDFHTSDGSAQAGADYVATNGTLTFNPGETIKTVVVRVIGDTERELEENFFLEIAPAANVSNLRLHAEGRILPDDFSLDVTVPQITGPDHWTTGTPLEITSTVQNIGTNDIRSRFTVGIYLSADPIITTNDQLIATRVVYRLPAGASSSEGSSVSGLQVPAGTYYLGAIADLYNSVNELDEANNAVTGNAIEIVPGPDLVASFVGSPAHAGTPGSILITNRLVNAGIGAAGHLTVGLYLSANQEITTNDLRIATRELAGLPVGATNEDIVTVVLPAHLASGAYYLGLIADELEEVIESNETNNALTGNQIEIVPGADLVLTRVAGSAFGIAGDLIIVTNIVRNVGLVSTPNIGARIGFYLSTDTVFTTNDLFIGSRFVFGLPAGASDIQATIVPLDPNVPAGTYYLGAIADDRNVIAEDREDNNALDGNVIQLVAGADLTVTVSSAPAVVATATPFLLTNTVRNIGNAYSLVCPVGFYLSSQSPVTTNDFKVGGRTLANLAVSASSAANSSVTIPPTVAPGTYYLGVIADDTNGLREVNEMNNMGSTQIQILAGPDLIVESLGVPTRAATGKTFTITNVVRNTGGWNVSSSFVVRFFLSTDATITTNDLFLTERTVGGLNAGQINSNNTSATVDFAVPTGSYYVGAIVDVAAQVSETLETNNTLTGPLIEIVPGPDLVSSAVAGPATGQVGKPITMNDTVANIGEAAAVIFTIGYFLSTDTTITTNDVFLGERSVFFVAAGGADSGSATVTIPASVAPGVYYLGAIADWRGRMSELAETNNVVVGNTITISLGADLELVSVSSPNIADRFSPILVTNTVRNIGGQNTGPFTVGVYLSSDSTVTTNDVRIGGRTVSGLVAGETNAEATAVNIISNTLPGLYYIGAIADDASAIMEFTKTNNARAGNMVKVVSGPDLVVTSVTGPARMPTGAFVSITNTIQNLGTDPITSTFILRNVLSPDVVISNTDFLLGDITITNGLPAGQSLTVVGTYLVAFSLEPGAYYLGAIADAQQQIAETNEMNNALAGLLVDGVLGPDLTLTTWAAPDAVVSGNSLSVTDNVANVGEGTAVLFVVGYYLSTDPVITTADLLLGQRSVTLISAGSGNTATTSVTIPGNVSPGTYYLGAIVDSLNSVREPNETNNTTAGSPITVMAGPDLEVALVSGPAVAGPPVSIAITNVVRNIGTGTASSFVLGLYLSTDSVITSNDVKLASRTISSLAPGASNTAVSTVQIPASVSVGTYYLGAIADESGSVSESNEANNTLSSSIMIVSGPDLVVTEVAGPVSAAIGESVFITNTVRNLGMTDITVPFQVALYLSIDSTITTDDARIGTRIVTNGLAAGQSITTGTPVNMLTILPGTYYLGAIVDSTNAVIEANETNNSLAGNTLTVAAILITEVHLETNDLVVSFPTVPGKVYRLERAANLNQVPVWQPVASAISVMGTGGIVSARDTGALFQPGAFYRVRLME